MITSAKNYPFGGKVSTVETPPFCCMISTAKDGFFKKQSVLFSDFSRGMEHRKHVAKLTYADFLDSNKRLEIHDHITIAIDQSGSLRFSLMESLKQLADDIISEGIGHMEFF